MSAGDLLVGTLLIVGVVSTSAGITIRWVERGADSQRFGAVVLAIGGILLGIFAAVVR